MSASSRSTKIIIGIGAVDMNAFALVGCSREIIRITDEVTLVILRDEGFGDAGLLQFKNGHEIEFAWSDDARQVFEDLEGADTIELLTVLAQVAK